MKRAKTTHKINAQMRAILFKSARYFSMKTRQIEKMTESYTKTRKINEPWTITHASAPEKHEHKTCT